MLTNIRGLVNTLELGQTQGMMPLYEAISNAIDAIAETGRSYDSGRIDIYLHRKKDFASSGDHDTSPVDGFAVSDNGVGFNNANFNAFKEAYTLIKVKVGGKGVGRFTYLKVFDDVLVQSVFEEGRSKQKRGFRFSIEREVHSESPIVKADRTEEPGTRITLSGMSERYRAGWPRESDLIAQRIVAHFLIRFAARSCPPVWLHDSGRQPIDLHRVFNDTIQPHIEEFSIAVKAHQFGLQVFRHKGGRDKHDLIYCATGREVTRERLRSILQLF